MVSPCPIACVRVRSAKPNRANVVLTLGTHILAFLGTAMSPSTAACIGATAWLRCQPPRVGTVLFVQGNPSVESFRWERERALNTFPHFLRGVSKQLKDLSPMRFRNLLDTPLPALWQTHHWRGVCCWPAQANPAKASRDSCPLLFSLSTV